MFLKQPLILSLGKILSGKFGFFKKTISDLMQSGQVKFVCTEILLSQVKFYLNGNQGVWPKNDTKGFVNIQKLIAKISHVRA